MSFRLRFCLLLPIAICAALAWWLLGPPNTDGFPVRGIDVSHHQGKINWPAVAASGQVQFAYLKATEGGDWSDSRFVYNWQQARKMGLRVGAYHFFTFCRDPSEQAEHFLNVLPLTDDSLPPAVDVEFHGNCKRRPSGAELREELRVWVEHVSRALGRTVVLYTTMPTYSDYFEDQPLPEVSLWLRDTTSQPNPDDRRWRFWQYTDKLEIEGITSPVDGNVFFGSLTELLQSPASDAPAPRY